MQALFTLSFSVKEIETRKVEQQCMSEERTEYCYCQTQGDIRVHGKSFTVFTAWRVKYIYAEILVCLFVCLGLKFFCPA